MQGTQSKPFTFSRLRENWRNASTFQKGLILVGVMVMAAGIALTTVGALAAAGVAGALTVFGWIGAGTTTTHTKTTTYTGVNGNPIDIMLPVESFTPGTPANPTTMDINGHLYHFDEQTLTFRGANPDYDNKFSPVLDREGLRAYSRADADQKLQVYKDQVAAGHIRTDEVAAAISSNGSTSNPLHMLGAVKLNPGYAGMPGRYTIIDNGVSVSLTATELLNKAGLANEIPSGATNEVLEGQLASGQTATKRLDNTGKTITGVAAGVAVGAAALVTGPHTAKIEAQRAVKQESLDNLPQPTI